MLIYVLPAIAALFTWWFATGLILWVGQRPKREHKIWMLVASLAALLALLVATNTANSHTLFATYVGFFSAIVIWAWHELSFLYGWVTGPNKAPCPGDVSFVVRFQSAFNAILYHELALLATFIVLFVSTIDAVNNIALITYGILWVMRISAKLNLFLGTPRPAVDMLPKRLEYLGSYFKTQPVGPFFIVSTTCATLGFGWLILQAALAYDPASIAATMLLVTLLGLALLEHWFFVIPFNETQLWSIFVRFRSKTDKTTTTKGIRQKPEIEIFEKDNKSLGGSMT